MMMVVWEQQRSFPTPYIPDPFLLFGCVCGIFLLVWVSYRLRNHRILPSNIKLVPSGVFGFFGIFMVFSIIFIPYIFADAAINSVITIVVQCISIGIIIVFTRLQLYNKKATYTHISSFILGVLMVFCVFFAPVNELANNALGMLPVGIIMALLILYWKYYIIKKARRYDYINTNILFEDHSHLDIRDSDIRI